MKIVERPVHLALVPGLSPVRRRLAARSLASLTPLVPRVLAAAPMGADRIRIGPAAQILSAEVTETRVAVFTLGPSPKRPIAILKMGCTEEAGRGLHREGTALCALQADPRLTDWCRLAPRVLAAGEYAGTEYMLQRFLPGRRGYSLLADASSRRRMLRAAAVAVADLHKQTATTAIGGTHSLDRWVGEPLRVVQTALARGPARRTAALERLGDELYASFRNRIVRVSWTHGDYWPGNLLVARGGSRVTGIVDWDQASLGQPPALDLLHLLLYTRALVHRCDLGDVVRETATSGVWPADELGVLDGLECDLPEAGAAARAITLLYWLRHLAGNFVQSAAYAHNRIWLRRNVDTVVRCL
jgi:Phosphotransferase enzyme family